MTDISMPRSAGIQHQETRDILIPIPPSKLRWSLLCVAMMVPSSPKVEPLSAPRTHKLIVKDGEPPAWEDSYIRKVPFVGHHLNIVSGVLNHKTELEDVADFLAEDLQLASTEWVGKLVGLKQKGKEAA